jgi:signal transduction histidine kinase/ActR/RegA family two-component response regulator
MTSEVLRDDASALRSGVTRQRHVGHDVRFYDGDLFPGEDVAEYLARALRVGGAAVAIATPEHAVELRAAIEAASADRLVIMDAEETFVALDHAGGLDENAFERVVGSQVRALRAAHPCVRVFGEMTDLFCRRGETGLALQLEALWNGLRRAVDFDLMCVYSFSSFTDAASIEVFRGVCTEHADVTAEPDRALAHEVERRRRLEHAHATRVEVERFLAQAATMLSTSLDSKETIQRVAKLPVPAVADWCIVDLLCEDGQSFDRIAIGHHRPCGAELADRLRGRFPLVPGPRFGLTPSVIERRPQLARDIDDTFLRANTASDEALELARALAMQSFLVTPLVARGRSIGAVTLVACERNYAVEELVVAENFASCAAAAIDNARLFEAEQRMRRRIAQLQDVTAALSRARTAAEVAEVSCRIGAAAIDASAASLWLARADGTLVLTGSWGAPEDWMDRFREIAPDTRGVPAIEVVRTGEPLWIETEENYARSSPETFEAAKAAGRVSAYAALPLTLDGRTEGLVSFGHPIGHHYDEGERAFLTTLAHHSSQALDRARLLDAERRTNDRLRLLAAASEVLSKSLDFEETVRSIARLTVPSFADWCVIDLVEGDVIRRVVSQHEDEAMMRLADEVARERPRHLGDGSAAAQVISSGEARFHPRIPLSALRAAARDPRELALFESAHLVSAITVPLIAQRERLGVITFTTAHSGRIYDRDDLGVAEELGRRAGLAVANARLYGAAQAAQHAAEEANRVKEEFLGTVSHELRTPLNAISGWAALLAQKPDDVASVKRGLAVISRNVEAQTKIVEDILDASRVISGKLRIDPRPTDLLAVVRDAIEVVRPSANAKSINIALTADTSDAFLLVGDAQRLQQVVWNLLSNAVKFTDENGHVTIELVRAPASIELVVRDDGRGIEPSLLPHVFDRFHQGDGSTTRRHGGLGLGLAIVRHIVELHGGRVEAESAGAGKGATLRVSLPVRAVAPRPESTARSLWTPEDDELAANDISGLRLLVVDDDRDARELLEALFVEYGAIVRTASSAREGLALAVSFMPDVILSDIGMPQEDGYMFIERVRSVGGAAGTTPAIALTAYARPEDRTRALRAGYNTHVTKPIEPRDLIAVIASLHAVARA